MSEENQQSDGDKNSGPKVGSIDNISLDTLYNLLSHHRRRAIIEVLLTHGRVLTLRDLRNEIVEREQGKTITNVSDEEVRRTLVSLYHVHLPHLAEEGVVNYDPDLETVEPTEKLENLEPFLSQE